MEIPDPKIENCSLRITIYLVNHLFINLFSDWRIYSINNKILRYRFVLALIFSILDVF